MRSSRLRRRRASLRPLPALAGALCLVSCIIPDRGIRAESDADNPGAVRIVESIPIVAEFLEACNVDPRMDPAGIYNPAACPQIPTSLRQGLIRGGPYCVCPGGVDSHTLPEFLLYADDPDRLRDEPADVLYAVALLDLDPLSDAPQNFVAYPEHFIPGGVGEYMPRVSLVEDGGRLDDSVGREANGLWRFRFGKDGGQGVDLCNDNNGETLPLGLHNLQIMVTDRPFFRPQRLDENGDPVLTPGGRPVLLPIQYGMPDLAAGATWAVANYVFECRESDASGCECVEAPP